MQAETSPRPFAIITGASRGIGAAYARALARRGYDLLLVARDKALLDAVAEEVQTNYGTMCAISVIDLSETDAAHRLYAASRQYRLTPDVIINNAGFGLFGEFAAMPMPRIQAMLRLHVNTIVETTRLFLPDMLERGRGGIITVSSMAGFFTMPYVAEYAATKTFLTAFFEALMEEVRGTGVRIQVCCPGTTRTDFHATAGYQLRSAGWAQTAEKVVEESLSALERGSGIVTTGWINRLLVLITRWLPRRWLTRMTARWIKH